jgi:hypothetical protein
LKWFFCSDADFFAILFGRACACPSAAARGTSRDISAESSVEFRKIPEHEALNPYDVGRCLAWYVRYLHAQMSRRGITEEERNSGVNLRVERYRLLKSQADLSE